MTDTAETDATARLNAAAPDLLAALIGLAEFVEDVAIKPAELQELQEALRAIAKAEGK